MKKATALLSAAFMILGLVNTALTQGGQAARPKPKFTKQVISLEGGEVTIIRDEFGVPHVLAGSERAVYYGGGYAVAQDRLFQLERFRRDARGRLAEIEGPSAFLRDQQVRRNGYTEEELRAQYDAMPAEVKQSFQAYADGINAYIKEAVEQGKLPAGFREAGITQPAPWTVTDSVAIGVMSANRFGSNGGSESLKVRVLKWLKDTYGEEGQKMFDDLYWINDPAADTTVPDEEKPSQSRRQAGKARPHAGNAAGALRIETLSDETLEEVTQVAEQRAVLEYNAAHSLPTKWGSYAWVVSPKRTISGSAILVGGPQMGFSTPSIAHEIHYSAGELNVTGMGFAGIPGVLIGHNDHLAWTATSGLSDVIDLFAEKVNPDNKYQYWYKGRYHDMQKRVEEIAVKGGRPHPVEVYRTVHGPGIAWDEKAGIAYSRAASFVGREMSDQVATHGFNRAKNIKEFAKYAEQVHTNRNYLAATVDGDIGYWHCGRLPIRARGVDVRLPTPGTGEYEWTGFVPFSEMPQSINPKQGFLINWNNKPTKSWDNGDQPEWGPIPNTALIERLIKSKPQLTFEQVREIAEPISTYEVAGEYIKPYLIAAAERTGAASRDARIREAVNYIKAWSNHTRDDSVSTRITRIALFFLRQEVLGDEFEGLNRIGLHLGGAAFDRIVQMHTLLRVLEGRKAGLPVGRDYFNGKNRDEVVVEALVKSLDNQAQERGPQLNYWGYRQGLISLGELPGIPDPNRATYIMAVELSKPMVRSVSMLPPGQSEDPGSANYDDQREMAGYWRYKPLFFTRGALEKAVGAESAGKK
jgi:penicillin amidase